MGNVLRLARLTAVGVVGIILAACGGGDSGSVGSSSSSSGKGSGGTGGGNGGGTPPTISMFTILDSVAAPWALAPQGQEGVGLQVYAEPSSGVQLVSMETTTVDASGNQVAPITTTSIVDQQGIIFASADIPQTPGFYTVEGWVTDSNGLKSGVASQMLQVVASAAYATVVTETGPGVSSLVQSNGMLYWVETGENAVKSAPVTGGAAKVLATRMVNPSAIAFSGSNVIWLDDRDGTVANCSARSVTRVLKQTTAGVSIAIASGPSCSGGASQIALIGSTVYWVSSTGSPATWVINASALGGSTSSVRMTTTPIVALAASGNTLYWMENAYPGGTASVYALPSGGPLSTIASGVTADSNTFAVDNTAVYYATPDVPATNPPTETLWAQALSGGAAKALNTAISVPVKLVSTLNQGGSSVVWISASAVNAVPAAGGAITQLATVSGVPVDVLYDGSAVDWSAVTGAGQYGESGSISSVPLTGGSTTTLYQGGDAPRELAQDLQGRLNWTEGGPVGVAEGFARIARLVSGSAATVVNGVNNSVPVALSSVPHVAMLSAAPTALLIADRWRIKSLPLTGGVLTTLAAANGGLIGGLTNDGTYVYWDDGGSAVNKAPIAGGPITVLVSAALLGPYYVGPSGPITLDPNGQLYWAVNDPGSVYILTAPSAEPSSTLDDISNGRAVGDMVESLVVNSQGVFFSDTSLSFIGAIPGSLPTPGGPWAEVPTVLELNDTTLYCVGTVAYGGFGTTIVKSSNNPLSSSMPLMSEDANGDPYALAIDGKYVYFVDNQIIRKTPL